MSFICKCSAMILMFINVSLFLIRWNLGIFNLSNMIRVGASDKNMARADFSNFGEVIMMLKQDRRWDELVHFICGSCCRLFFLFRRVLTFLLLGKTFLYCAILCCKVRKQIVCVCTSNAWEICMWNFGQQVMMFPPLLGNYLRCRLVSALAVYVVDAKSRRDSRAAKAKDDALVLA